MKERPRLVDRARRLVPCVLHDALGLRLGLGPDRGRFSPRVCEALVQFALGHVTDPIDNASRERRRPRGSRGGNPGFLRPCLEGFDARRDRDQERVHLIGIAAVLRGGEASPLLLLEVLDELWVGFDGHGEPPSAGGVMLTRVAWNQSTVRRSPRHA